MNHQFYNSSCLRAFPLYFIYIFATVCNSLSLSSFLSEGSVQGSVTGRNCWQRLILFSSRVSTLAGGAVERNRDSSKRFCEVVEIERDLRSRSTDPTDLNFRFDLPLHRRKYKSDGNGEWLSSFEAGAS